MPASAQTYNRDLEALTIRAYFTRIKGWKFSVISPCMPRVTRSFYGVLRVAAKPPFLKFSLAI